MQDTPQSAGGTDDARSAAISSLRRRSQAKRLVILFALVEVMLIVIWAASGRGSFWPLWPGIGMGMAAAWSLFGAYGPANSPSEGQIDREMRRQQG